MSPPRKKAKDGQLISPHTDSASSGFIRFYDHTSSIRRRGQLSNEVEVLRSRWKLLVKATASSKMEVFLVRRTFDTRVWSVDVSAKFKLVRKGNDGNRELEMKEWFHKGKTRAGVEFDLKFNGNFIIEARFTLSNFIGFRLSFSAIDFTTPVDPHHDITFMFDGEKLYACKQILALHSPVFNAMFFGNFTEKDKKEIELKDIDREDFHVVLKTLYDPTYKIEEDMNLLESVLVLADRYDIKEIIERVEQQLINSRKFSVAQLLLFVDQHRAFRFIKLHTRAWERLEEQIEKEQKKVPVEKVSGSDEYSQLSVEAKSACDEIEQLCKQGSSFQDPHWKTKPNFDFTTPFSTSDVILIVEGKELHVHKEFVIDQIASFLQCTRAFDGLKMILYFGYDMDLQNNPAYKEMNDDKAIKAWSKTDVSS